MKRASAPAPELNGLIAGNASAIEGKWKRELFALTTSFDMRQIHDQQHARLGKALRLGSRLLVITTCCPCDVLCRLNSCSGQV